LLAAGWSWPAPTKESYFM